MGWGTTGHRGVSSCVSRTLLLLLQPLPPLLQLPVLLLLVVLFPKTVLVALSVSLLLTLSNLPANKLGEPLI